MATAVTTTMKYARNEQKRGRAEYSYVQIDINDKGGVWGRKLNNYSTQINLF
jgi:hypothetical protein